MLRTLCPCTTDYLGGQIEFLFNYIKNIWMQEGAECVLAGQKSMDAARSRGWFSLAGYQVSAQLTEEGALLVLYVGDAKGLW